MVIASSKKCILLFEEKLNRCLHLQVALRFFFFPVTIGSISGNYRGELRGLILAAEKVVGTKIVGGVSCVNGNFETMVIIISYLGG